MIAEPCELKVSSGGVVVPGAFAKVRSEMLRGVFRVNEIRADEMIVDAFRIQSVHTTSLAGASLTENVQFNETCMIGTAPAGTYVRLIVVNVGDTPQRFEAKLVGMVVE